MINLSGENVEDLSNVGAELGARLQERNSLAEMQRHLEPFRLVHLSILNQVALIS